jgi:hypothetical protein
MLQLLKNFPNNGKKKNRPNNVSALPNKTQEHQDDGTNNSIFEYMVPPPNNYLMQASN